MSVRVRGKLPRALIKALDDAEEGLRTFIEDERAAIEATSERWQKGEHAALIVDWLDTLDEAVYALGECHASAD